MQDFPGTGRVVAEWVVVLLATPFLAFPFVYPRLTIAALVFVFVAVVMGTVVDHPRLSLWRLAGPFRAPLAVIVVMTAIGAFVSPFRDLTIPKLLGLVLGLLVLRAVLVTGTIERRVRLLAFGYALAGCGAVFVGLLASPGWGQDNLALYEMASFIPRVIERLPGMDRAVNPNALGGFTLLFLPLITAQLLVRPQSPVPAQHRLPAALAQTFYGLAFVVLVMTLMLSQSRTAVAAAVASMSLVIAFRYRNSLRPRVLWWSAVTGAIPGVVIAVWVAPPMLADFFATGGRLSLWTLAVDALKQSPLVGVGLGTFGRVAYRMVGISGVTHAHNTFLQVALDWGVPGLLAYVALLILATRMVYVLLWRCDSHRARDRGLYLGLWASLFAIHVFGLMDAVAPGAKIGVFMWWNLGLIGAFYRVAQQARGRDSLILELNAVAR